jgi:hypothetical protein
VELGYSWDTFVDEVKHHSRYFFASNKDSDNDAAEGSYSPLVLLREIGRMAESLGLIRVIPSGTKLFRVRNKKPETSLNSFAEMGPPPRERATAGRMNPAGISYFYLALEDKTARAEVFDKPPSHVGLATFTSSTDLRTLDLA